MSAYRKKGKYYSKYYNSTDYYSNTAYQESGSDNYTESGTDAPDGYQDYAAGYQDYAAGYQDYADGYQGYTDGYQGYTGVNQEDIGGYQGYTDVNQEDIGGYQGYTGVNQENAGGYQGYTSGVGNESAGYQGYYGRTEVNDGIRQPGQTYPYLRYPYRRQYQPYQSREDREKAEETQDNSTQNDLQTESDKPEDIRRRRSGQHRRMREEKLRKRRRRLLIALAVRAACMLGALIAVIPLFRLIFFSNPVKRKVILEAGTELDVKDFMKKDKVKGKFVTEASDISLDHVGEQKVQIEAKGKVRESRLIVKDTKAPKAEAAGSVIIDVDGKLKAKELVKNIKDATDVKCSYKKKPDLSKKGKTSAVVLLTDEGGNTSEVESNIKVIVDKEAPVIDGVAPLTGFIDEPISYKSSITVSDNCVRDIDVKVDNSKVDTKTEGTYDVTYTAVDRAGNKAEETTTITIKEKPENYITPEEVQEEADEILKKIIKKGMTKKEKAKAIYNWIRKNVGYISKSNKDSWTNGAHQGFTQRAGDCFVFFSTAKALLTQAGIPNLDVVKSDTSHSSHYWSLIDCGDGWYHFDTTPRQGTGDDFFMKTDAEILAYSQKHRNSHIFDQSLYPATPEEDSTIK